MALPKFSQKKSKRENTVTEIQPEAGERRENNKKVGERRENNHCRNCGGNFFFFFSHNFGNAIDENVGKKKKKELGKKIFPIWIKIFSISAIPFFLNRENLP